MAAGLRVDPSLGWVRGTRAAALTVPAVGAASLTHVMVDGCASWLAAGLAAALCWPAAVAVLGARRRLPALLVWVVAAQLVTHVLLERMCAEVTSGSVSLSGHLLASLTPRMLLAHAGCALLTAVLLHRADAGLWAADALLRVARLVLAAFGDVVVCSPVVVGRAPRPSARVDVVMDLWRSPCPSRRGPPALSHTTR